MPARGTIGAVSFWVTVASLAVGIGALVFAFLSAKRGGRLLKRLVVYPFREQDQEWASFKESERVYLLDLYRSTTRGRKELDSAAIAPFIAKSLQYSSDLVDFLVGKGWVERTEKRGLRIARQKLAYLNFIVETQG